MSPGQSTSPVVLKRQELRRRRQQDIVVIERISSKQFDMSKRSKIENWLADILFQDFLERKGFAQGEKKGGATS